jgi:hypothetical protein
VLGAQAGGGDPAPYAWLSGYPLTLAASVNPQFQFDRNSRFGYQESLSYQIVVDWVIAQHKSQGLFQTRCQQDRFENFWVFTDEALAATVRFSIALVNCDRCFIYVRDGAELALWVWKHLDQEEPEHTKLAFPGKVTQLCWRNMEFH